jgi:hypothetical protein
VCHHGRLAAEQTKRSLSQSPTAPISIESLHEGEDLRSNINRPMYDTLTAPLLARIVAVVEETLAKAGATKADVDEVRPRRWHMQSTSCAWRTRSRWMTWGGARWPGPAGGRDGGQRQAAGRDYVPV